MMNDRSVFWTNAARSDIEEIVSYIAKDNVNNALQILEKLETKVAALSFQADGGRLVPELSRLDIFQYHELIECPWRIIYRIDVDNVFILAVLDGRRDLPSILLQRLIRA